MGNIRTSFVKRLAKELIETHKGVFTTFFTIFYKFFLAFKFFSDFPISFLIKVY